MTRTRFWLAAWLAVAALVTGCASYRSNYPRAHTAPRELVWGYDDGFQIARDGRVIAEVGDWGGLAEATSCVPQARSWAESAASSDRWGKTILWTGMAIMLAGVAGGSWLMLDDLDDTDQVLTGLGVMGGGLVVGLITIPIGAVERAQAETRAIDAVNLYNDEIWRGGCAR